MQNLVNKKVDTWVRPWNIEKFNQLEERDERFFSLVIKGALGWLTRNIVMYNKPIKHFIFNTGSSYLYMEENGYEYAEGEVTGEDMMYMSLPRCVCDLGEFGISTEELSSQYSRGTYERTSSLDGQIHGYNAELRRLPIEIDLKLNYVLGTLNEALILIQEIMDKMMFQRYFKIVYLGEIIQCSIEFPTNQSIQFNKIDMSSPDDKTKKVEMSVKIKTSYPQIDVRSECDNSNVIAKFGVDMNLHPNLTKDKSDEERYKYED